MYRGEHDPFSKTTLLVSTGDGATNRRVRQAFRQAGFPEEAMNLDVVPHEKTRFRNHHLPWALDLSDTIAWQYRVNVSKLLLYVHLTTSWKPTTVSDIIWALLYTYYIYTGICQSGGSCCLP